MVSLRNTLMTAALAVDAVCAAVQNGSAADGYFSKAPNSTYAYPSPNATGIGGWDVAITKAKRFVDRLTIDEMVSICTGNGFPSTINSDKRPCQGGILAIPRVDFAGLCYTDSDTGIGNSHSYGTGFPNGISAASTFNRELIRARAFAIGEEFKAKGIHAVLGPVLESGRYAGGGTNFEGFGNDPYLTGAAGYETVIGHQAAGVQAEPKQFLGYQGQSTMRKEYSSNIDNKALHEVYVWPYAEAVRAGAACVMTSYPYVNNTQPSQSGYLLNNILKTHLAFQGYTQSDWFALKTGVNAINSGMDQDMPGVISAGAEESYFGANYTEAVKNGSVPEWRLRDAATRIMTPYYFLGQDINFPQTNMHDDPRLAITDAQRQRHVTVAREVATAAIVLLKNTQGKQGLPLRKPTTIALFGPAAGQNPYGPNQYGYGTEADPSTVDNLSDYFANDPLTIGIGQGTMAEGGGSGTTFYPRLVDPISAIQQRAAQDLTLVDWATTTNTTFIAAVAKRGTVCFPVVSSFGGEGTDRNLTILHKGDEIIKTVAENCDNTIPIVQSVGPVDMEKWVDHPNVTAIIWANLGGQELGAALVDILYGNVNPSGRLVYTIARNESDYDQSKAITEPLPHPQIKYTEGVSVDYRGFEKDKVTPRFWFGHGLSYSNFTYSKLHIRKYNNLDKAIKSPIKYKGDAPGGDMRLYDGAVMVSFDIRNDGPFDGTEIPQLYLQLPEEAGNPTKILRGFESVSIRDEEKKNVQLYLTRKDISYWSVTEQTWVTPKGEFKVLIGASSNDIRLKGSFSL